MQPQTLPVAQTVTLDAGTKFVIVGANDAGVSRFRIAGEDRYEFMNVGEIKHTTALRWHNILFMVMNGRIPEDVQEQVQSLAEKAKVGTIYVTANSAALQRMMENFPLHNKGVITFQIPEVVQVIEFPDSNGRKSQSPPSPPADPAPPGSPGPNPPPKPPDPKPPPPPVTLQSMLDRIEELYDEYGGDHKKVIASFREAGFTEDRVSYQTLYGRCMTIRKRRERTNGSSSGHEGDLSGSQKTQELLTAIEEAKAVQANALQLAAEMAAEYERMRDVIAKQAEQLSRIPGLEEELRELREAAEKVRQILAPKTR